MKNKIYFLIFIFLPIAIIMLWNLFSNTKRVTPSNEVISITEALYKAKAIDNNYDLFLNYSFKNALSEMNLKYHLNLNGNFRSDFLNVYVVNFDSLNNIQKMGNLSVSEFSSFVRNNFVALPPNLIIIDTHFLSYLILNCYNELLSSLQATNSAINQHFKDPADQTKFLTTQSAISTYLAIGNYNLYKSKDKRDLNIDSLAYLINKEITLAGEYKPFFIYLLPIISHELAHIKYHDKKAMGWVDFKELIRTQLSIYREEQRADNLSYATIRKYLAENKDSSAFNLSLISFCRTMRNMVLTDTYNDFRNINPADLIVTLEQKQNLSDDDLKLPFHYYQRVASGYENTPPPMTEEEFNKFLSDLNKSGSNLAHRHMFQRCKSIINIVEDNLKTPITFLDSWVQLLSVYKLGKGYTDSLFIDDSLENCDISKSKVLNHLENDLLIKNAVNYPNNKTQICFLKNGGGYVELHGNDENLKKVVLVIDTRGKNGDMDSNSVINLAFMIRFVANLYESDAEGMQKASEAHALLRNPNGNLPTFVVKCKNNNIIKYTPLNQSFYVKIEFSKLHNLYL